MVDYWSNFFEVADIHSKTAHAVVTQLKVQLAHHGIPEMMISEFDNQEFTNYPQIGSSNTTIYPQAKEKVKKCDENL